MKGLGLSAFQHASAAALLVDGVPVAAAQEERFTRRRGDSSFPTRAIRFCLRMADLRANELDWVVFYEKPLRRFERLLVSQLRGFPKSTKPFSRTMFQWLGSRLWLKQRIADELGIPTENVLFTEHHVAHAASTFLSSPYDEAAILVADDDAEWATTSLAHGHGGQVEILDQIRFPHSLGLLSAAIAEFINLEGHGGVGRLVSLAAHGRPRFASEMESLLSISPDGSFALDLSRFRFAFDDEQRVDESLQSLLGPPRAAQSNLRYAGDDTTDADIAASLQQRIEAALLALAEALHRRVPSPRLCLAGEVALNTAAVGRLLRDGPFEEVFVPPAPGDGGAALGAALAVHAGLASGAEAGSNGRAWSVEHAFLGEPLAEDPREDARPLADDDAVVDAIVQRLLAGKTVGWARGRFEWGGRSLGHRSVLADPRSAGTADHLRRAVKHREAYRPYDGAVPAERAAEYFELPEGGRASARFMAVRVRATDACREQAPAIVHVDGSARPQLVSADIDPLFHRVLVRFGEASGVPVLLQTSLNLRGEPIARGEADALAVLERTALDALVVENRLYEGEQPARGSAG